MVLRILIYACLIHVLSSQSPATHPQCLTGYMTDVQSWVDYNGRLTVGADKNNSIDVSFQLNYDQQIRQELQRLRCTRRNSVKYLSMARCQLERMPMVSRYKDACGRCLSETIEYWTLFGNNFVFRKTSKLPYEMPMYTTNETTVSEAKFNKIVSTSPWANGLRRLQLPRLRELDLRRCGIQELEYNVFTSMPNLEKLYLGENNIFSISVGSFSGLGRLSHLDISRNYKYDENKTNKVLYFDDWNILQSLTNLTSLDFSFTKFTQRNIFELGNISRRLQSLSICHAGLSMMRPSFFAGTSLRFLDVSGNVNIFRDAHSLHGLETTLQVVYANKIGLNNLDVFENLTSLEILIVSNNEISVIETKTVRNLMNLQVLVLDMNRLTTWFRPTVSLMPNLKFLSLRNNNINLISEEMAKDFKYVSYIGMTGNFIVCNCNAREIFELALRNEMTREEEFIVEINNNKNMSTNSTYHRGYEDVNNAIANRKHVKPVCIENKSNRDKVLEISGKFLLFDYDEAKYHCLVVSEGKSTEFARVPTCKMPRDIESRDLIGDTWNKLYLLVILIVLMPFFFIGYVYRRNFRYFLITIRNSTMLSLINKDEVIDENTIFNYDVFVSYCNEDRGWVLDYLLPHVESDCSVSVCLHERDFLVGLSILENIVSCMDRSKAIMLIISKRFLLSQWCQFEMHLAQHRLLETRREDLILVLLEDIPRRLRPNTLHYLMLTNTYIVWSKEEAEQVLFWRRLKKTLVTHKMRQPENVSLV